MIRAVLVWLQWPIVITVVQLVTAIIVVMAFTRQESIKNAGSAILRAYHVGHTQMSALRVVQDLLDS